MTGIDDHSDSAFALPAGTVTFLLTDIAGSTRQWEAEPESMAKAVARHYELVADAVGRHGGVRPVEQGEGDSIVAAFSRASDALAAGVDAQLALASERWPGSIDLRVRMALHTGEARLRDQGNYFGQAVIRCARLRALAHGGQLIVSRAVRDLVSDRLPDGVTLRDLGVHRLRDLGRPEHVFQLDHPRLRRDFPSLLSLDAVPNNLPVQLTSFVGRERELADLRRQLESARLLTLTGSGGCGKTRLACQLGAELLDDFDGIWYVDLAPLGETTSVARAVAIVLSLADSVEVSLVDLVLDRLRGERALLVVDNCEHLLAESAAVVDAILKSCPRVQVIATSRAPLNVEGETAWRVPSLGLPPDGEPEPIEAIADSDAIRLFVERATRSRPNFALTDQNANAVVTICRRLDGIPLAIELAAARVRALAPDQILAGLVDRFRLLTGGSRTLMPRQQTLRASVDWSHALLREPEQVLLRRLAVFAGGFTLDAAEAICAGEGIERQDVLDVITQLVDRSLVQVDDLGAEVRYWLLETIKQYARQHLEDAGEAPTVRDRHLVSFAGLAGAAAPGLLGSAQGISLDRLRVEHDNLRAALEWADASLDSAALLPMAVDLTFFWLLGGWFKEGTGWLERAVATTPPDPPTELRARALWGIAYLNFLAGNMLVAYEGAQEALAWAEASGDDLSMARALDTIGSLQINSDPIGAIATLAGAADKARLSGDAWALTESRQKTAYSLITQDRYDEALQHLGDESAHEPALRNHYFVAWHGIYTAIALIFTGDVDEAQAVLAAARTAAEAAGEPQTITFAAMYQGEAHIRAGDPEQALAVIDDCSAQMTRRGAPALVHALLAAVRLHAQLANGDPAGAAAAGAEILALFAAEQLSIGERQVAVILADALLALGDPDGARDVLARQPELAAATGGQRDLALSQLVLGSADLAGGDPEAAEGHVHQALATFVELGTTPDVVEALEMLARAAADQESLDEAARLLGACERARATRGWRRWPLRQPAIDALHSVLSAALGAAMEAVVEEGAALSLEDAVAYARRARGTRGRPSTGWGSLTPTELQVVKLVVAGCTNPQIGDRLFIARATVKTHLSHIFTKLSVTSRAELAAQASRRGI